MESSKSEIELNRRQPAKVVAIVGPTGTGKSRVGVETCLALHGEVVSADSMQVYKHMNIGTAKVTPAETQGVRHHMLDVVEPGAPFTVAEYVRLADRVIADILARGRVPVIVGGTGLYVKALLEDFLFPDQGADVEFRERMAEVARTEGKAKLHAMLAQVDPKSAARLHPNDERRVVRALEVHHRTGMPMSEQMAAHKPGERRYDALKIGLTAPRDVLYSRIEERVDSMLAHGLLEEVRALAGAGIDMNSTSMQALGYKEMLPVLRGEMGLTEAVALLKRETRRYAKRQLSWFGQDKDIIWFDITQYGSPRELAGRIAALHAGRFARGAEH